VASLPYSGKGFAIDFETLPSSASTKTFETGKTYYIPTGFCVGPGAAIFEPGCVTKYGNNAWLIMFGQPSFPDTQQTPVFTSANDDSFGEDVDGNPNDLPSVPSYSAMPALWIYYVTFPTDIKNVDIRWAHYGVQYDQNPGVYSTHWLFDSLFEKCETGIYLNLPYGAGLNLLNVKKCSVTTPIAGSGSYFGSMTDSLYCMDKAFLGLKNTDPDFAIYGNMTTHPPDTMGAVGPDHFVVCINSITAVFDKNTGKRLEFTNATAFFGAGDIVDPRIIFDKQCQRWIACGAQKVSGGNVCLAVSRSSNPTGLVANWDRYALLVSEPGFTPDFPTLGADQNGVYVAVSLFDVIGAPTAARQKIVAIKKTANCLYPINTGDVFVLPTLNSPFIHLTLQPAVNFDPVAADGIAWFVAKGARGGSYGPIHYARLWWSPNGPGLLEDPWNNSLTVPQAYYDLDRLGFGAPEKSCTNGLDSNLEALAGSKLTMSVVRNGYLWTCHHVGLDGGDAIYNGGTVDRTGCGWFKLKILGTGQLSINTGDGADYNRFYDTAGSTPYSYYFPSLMVNSTNDMVMGFSGSRSNEYIGAFFTGRRSSGATLNRPVLVQAGRNYYTPDRWGDYSYTSLDVDDLTFWTIQEYAETDGVCDGPRAHYGTWISKIKRNP